MNEPTEYYERLILKISDNGIVKKEDARKIAEQYNYVSLLLTQEYFMPKNGYGDIREVAGRMIDTIKFFCVYIRDKQS